MKNDSLTKSITSSKNFSYSKKGVELNFTLRIDNSSQLKPFLVCLEEAEKDVTELLKGMKN